jgi:hypothetical protein
MGLSFTIATGQRQRIHSRVRVPWDSRPYFTVSDSRLHFLSPPTTRLESASNPSKTVLRRLNRKHLVEQLGSFVVAIRGSPSRCLATDAIVPIRCPGNDSSIPTFRHLVRSVGIVRLRTKATEFFLGISSPQQQQ